LFGAQVVTGTWALAGIKIIKDVFNGHVKLPAQFANLLQAATVA
jgi:hypothetical protein